jgi:hypothetical protein
MGEAGQLAIPHNATLSTIFDERDSGRLGNFASIDNPR